MASIVTPYFRVSYPSVFEKKLNKLSGKMEYSVVALFPKGADLSAMKKAAQEAIADQWGTDEKKWPKNLRNPFRKHEEKTYVDEATGQERFPDGMEAGGIFLNLKSEKNKPQVLDAQKNEILDPSDFYAGCWARASVNAYAYQHPSGNCGVNFGLNNLQKWKEGDPLGSRTRAQDDFAPIEGAGPAGGGTAAGLFD